MPQKYQYCIYIFLSFYRYIVRKNVSCDVGLRIAYLACKNDIFILANVSI